MRFCSTADRGSASKRFVRPFALIALFLFVSAAWGNARAETVTIAGSAENTEIVAALASAFVKANPGARVDVPEPVGSSGGIKAVLKGKALLARVARELKSGEVEDGMRLEIFAVSPVVFAAHPSVGVRDLTSQQILGIYSMDVKDWSALGGKPGKIYPLGPEAGDSMRLMLERAIPGYADAVSWFVEDVESSQELQKAVRKHPGTVAYIPVAVAKSASLEPLSFNGVAPTPANVASGAYTLTIPLGLAYKDALSGSAKAFLDFVFSPEGERIIKEFGCLPKPRK